MDVEPRRVVSSLRKQILESTMTPSLIDQKLVLRDVGELKMKSKGSVHRHQNLHQMESKPTIPTLPTEAENSSNDLLEQVRRCAYELYEERGKEDGHDIENWLRPELEVTQKSTKAAAA